MTCLPFSVTQPFSYCWYSYSCCECSLPLLALSYVISHHWLPSSRAILRVPNTIMFRSLDTRVGMSRSRKPSYGHVQVCWRCPGCSTPDEPRRVVCGVGTLLPTLCRTHPPQPYVSADSTLPLASPAHASSLITFERLTKETVHGLWDASCARDSFQAGRSS